MRADVVIAGGGLAAVRTAQTLRDRGFDGTITLAAAESELPYDRPPLSKGYLLGRVSDDGVQLLTPQRYAELGLELRLGDAVSGLDPAARRLRLAGGDELAYGHLVVATGARPVRPPALEGYPNVLYLRTLADARVLRNALRSRPRVGVIGGGFIGLEVAAAAVELGSEVTVVEGASAPLASVLGPKLGRWIQTFHEERGVAFRCGSLLRRARSGTLAGELELELESGAHVVVDVVVVGVGVTPDVEWLREAGLTLHRGLVCDAHGRSSDPHVFGAGDATCRHAGGRCHASGHWTGASEQAGVVAATLAGDVHEPPAVGDGYFWSDQHGVRLQFAGVAEPGAPVTVTSGSVHERRFVALCGEPDRVTGVFAMDNPREFLRARLALKAARPERAAA